MRPKSDRNRSRNTNYLKMKARIMELSLNRGVLRIFYVSLNEVVNDDPRPDSNLRQRRSK